MSSPTGAEFSGSRLGDQARFLFSWLLNPKGVGAVAPSGPALARTMAAIVDPAVEGPIVELGPGTGPVTKALVDRGIEPKRLVLVEFEKKFCDLLFVRFPLVNVVQGDAFALEETLKGHAAPPFAAVVSSLPLLNFPHEQRKRLIESTMRMLRPGAPFIQFTYGANSPLPLQSDLYETSASKRVWWNLPPAQVWTYRAK
ncbi:MAG: methyltransferase domain-containing protein [Xanthobacteraceae bacterium]|nr:methyltransferase domain-containing protein [Xanthobacteraceae bacterium]QYK45027.1 MAG: methyltransferase domain-containing protein [Xanthobacteraceae bacterium]HMN52269.1 methyltransferase domain-containing protein [Xanthobacteraceae bacterium]